MKSFLGMSTVVFGFIAVVGACGSDNNDKYANSPMTPEPRAMNQLTPSEQKEAQARAAKEDERERLAASQAPNEPSRTSNALAVSSIATARCDRELRCKNIGTNQKYLSTDECITKLQNDKRTDLNAQECPGGVSDKDLTSCLKAIREESCSNPLDSISRLTACRAGALCLK